MTLQTPASWTLLAFCLGPLLDIAGFLISMAWVRRRQHALEARMPRALAAELGSRLEWLERISCVDALTGLRAGMLFLPEFDQLSRTHARIALLYIDLDDFRRKNEGGHRDVGDAALTAAAQAIRRATRRRCDPVYRLHGDEFAVVLPDARADVMQHCALAILAALAAAGLSATIGGACSELLPWHGLVRMERPAPIAAS